LALFTLERIVAHFRGCDVDWWTSGLADWQTGRPGDLQTWSHANECFGCQATMSNTLAQNNTDEYNGDNDIAPVVLMER